METIDQEMMEIMVADYLADHPEYADDPIILDGNPYQDEDGWHQDAHDEEHTYILSVDVYGDVYISTVYTR